MAFDFVAVAAGLERLRSAPGKPDIFGAQAHQFRLFPPASEAEIIDFERKHRCKLPVDYRAFILLAGNGGAGPAYGFFKLGEMDDGFNNKTWQEKDGFVGSLSRPFPFNDNWNDLTGMPGEQEEASLGETGYEAKWSEFEQRYYREIDGAFPICHEGCALRQWLVVTGAEAGNIWCDYTADYRGWFPLVLPGLGRVTFLQWYMHWLEQSLLLLNER